MDYVFWAIWVVCFIVMLVYYRGRKNPILSATFSMVLGVSGLIVCHFFGGVVDFTPPINTFNTMLSLTLGLPSLVLIYIVGG